MKKYQKLICVFTVIALMIGCCCFPASAATINDNSETIFNYPTEARCQETNPDGSNFDNLGTLDLTHTIIGDPSTTYVQLPNWDNNLTSIRCRYYLVPFDLKESIHLSKGEILHFNTTFRIRANTAVRYSQVYAFIIQYHGWIDDRNTSVTGAFYEPGPVYSYGGSYQINSSRKMPEDFEFTGISIYACVIMAPSSSDPGYYFGFQDNEVTIRYGSEDTITQEIQNDKTNETLGEILDAQFETNDLLEDVKQNQVEIQNRMDDMITEQEKTNEMLGEITADKYPAPDDSTLKEYEEISGELDNSTKDGLNSAANMFKSFSLSTFQDGLLGIASMYNRVVPFMPWLNELLLISLALGLFSFLCGMAMFAVGRLNANDRAAKTSAYRRAMYRKGRGK